MRKLLTPRKYIVLLENEIECYSSADQNSAISFIKLAKNEYPNLDFDLYKLHPKFNPYWLISVSICISILCLTFILTAPIDLYRFNWVGHFSAIFLIIINQFLFYHKMLEIFEFEELNLIPIKIDEIEE